MTFVKEIKNYLVKRFTYKSNLKGKSISARVLNLASEKKIFGGKKYHALVKSNQFVIKKIRNRNKIEFITQINGEFYEKEDHCVVEVTYNQTFGILLALLLMVLAFLIFVTIQNPRGGESTLLITRIGYAILPSIVTFVIIYFSVMYSFDKSRKDLEELLELEKIEKL